MKNHTTASKEFTFSQITKLFGTENTVCLTPRPITDDMTPLQREAWRILWDRWELAAITLFNLRNMAANREVERQIERLMRKFPDVDNLFPATCFEPEFETDAFVEWH